MRRKILSVFMIFFPVLFFLVTACEKGTSGDEFSSGPAAARRVAVESDPDSVSAASNIYYQENTLSVEELREAVHTLKGGALAVATVNEDGSPNLAYVGPDMVTDKVLMFGLSDNQTRKNIERRKLAVAGVYIYDPDSEGGLADSVGARLVLELIEDEGLIGELRGKVPEAPEDVLFMRIVRILPVG
jgi:hypothetical protein